MSKQITVKTVKQELLKALSTLEKFPDDAPVTFSHDVNGTVIYKPQMVVNFFHLEVGEFCNVPSGFIEIAATMNCQQFDS